MTGCFGSSVPAQAPTKGNGGTLAGNRSSSRSWHINSAPIAATGLANGLGERRAVRVRTLNSSALMMRSLKAPDGQIRLLPSSLPVPADSRMQPHDAHVSFDLTHLLSA